MMFSVQMHSRSKRHVNAQKIDVHATAVATILRPIGRPCANIIPPLSYSPATLFSSPPLPPPNQTKPNPTQPNPLPTIGFSSYPFIRHPLPPLCPIPIYHSAPSDPTTPSFHPPILFSALSPAPLPPSYRASFFSSLSTALATLARATAEPATGIPFLERGREGGGFAASFRCTPMAISVHAPRTQDDEEDRSANRGATSLLSLSRGNRTYRARSCLDRVPRVCRLRPTTDKIPSLGSLFPDPLSLTIRWTRPFIPIYSIFHRYAPCAPPKFLRPLLQASANQRVGIL